jgi:hypothetical protein
MPSRKERLLAALAEHPGGVVADLVLRRTGPPDERLALAKQLCLMARRGQVRITGRTAPNRIASAIVELSTDGCGPQSRHSQKPPSVRERNSNSDEDFRNTSGDLP